MSNCVHSLVSAIRGFSTVTTEDGPASVEPGGAAGLAAAMFRRFPADASGVLTILSGGNVDAKVFERSIGRVPR